MSKGSVCDGCLKQMNTKRAQVSHLRKGGFDLEADDESDEFFCETYPQKKKKKKVEVFCFKFA